MLDFIYNLMHRSRYLPITSDSVTILIRDINMFIILMKDLVKACRLLVTLILFQGEHLRFFSQLKYQNLKQIGHL